MSRTLTRRVTSCSLGCALAVLVAASPAAAQPSGADKASAEALFNEGIALVALGKYADGCRKFEGSQALDPTLGAELRLADCYERQGKTASAWASFKHAQGVARVQNQSEREELARQRVEALEAKLVYLSVELTGPAPSGLVIERNSGAVPLASLGVAIPIDPGEQRLTARAKAHEPWHETIRVAPGPGHIRLRIPVLKRSAPVAPAVPPAKARHFGVQRSAGIVSGAIGLASLLAGSALGLYAKREGDRSKQDAFCPNDDHNGCTQQGLELRDRARAFGTASTITFIAGGALVTTGIVLFSTASSQAERSAHAGLQLRAAASSEAYGASLRGCW